MVVAVVVMIGVVAVNVAIADTDRIKPSAQCMC